MSGGQGPLWIYVLECANGSLYTGYTRDLVQRYRAHLAGTASKYTRGYPPRRIAGCWRLSGSRGAALRVERLVKRLDRRQKLSLIERPQRLAGLIRDELGLELALRPVDPGDLAL